MIQICVLAIAGLFAALIIKKDKPEFAVLIIMLVSFFIAIRILTVLGNAVEELESWESILGGNIAYISLLLKIIGITYVCDFAANLCKDSGYAALSNHIELFGKVAIMVAGFPIIRIMIDMLEGMMR
ncbi:MAG: stage III sporulation protein AD [Lachnospiraceae bacterium]|jgi:stage III sporulation protein AD|nr:stage III sporulation protein AD [Lachnospiraceae bacterium A4]MCI8265474.1 stage III sporulation protein AD [Lachnospiraceae bacterium]MCI8973025.1 stage III sporulation protein AD [Lachnospiraceae bacterium]